MAQLTAFTFTTINGFFAGENGDISWHRHGAEENGFAAESLASGNRLLFGRITYEMMASYWPTPIAEQNDATVAQGMNDAEKIVFSRTLESAAWQNTHVVHTGMIDAIRELKKTSTRDLTILGSGSIVTQCTAHGLIDTYQIMIDPVILGKGSTLFDGLETPCNLHLISTKPFSSGVVLFCYEKA